MQINFGIVWGLLAMFGWGIADFFVAKAVKKATIFQVFFWSQSLALLIVPLLFLFFFKSEPVSWFSIVIIMLCGALNIIAYLALYKGFQVGKVAIVSPIAASWVMVAVMLSLLFLGEQLSPAQGIGLIIGVTGIILTSFKLSDFYSIQMDSLAQGVTYGFIHMLTTGIQFFLLDSLVTGLHWFLPTMLMRITMFFYLLPYAYLTKKSLKFPTQIVLPIILIGFLEMMAILSYGYGISKNDTAFVAPIAAAFPMITVILARIFFKEKIENNQKLGITAILISLILLSLHV